MPLCPIRRQPRDCGAGLKLMGKIRGSRKERRKSLERAGLSIDQCALRRPARRRVPMTGGKHLLVTGFQLWESKSLLRGMRGSGAPWV